METQRAHVTLYTRKFFPYRLFLRGILLFSYFKQQQNSRLRGCKVSFFIYALFQSAHIYTLRDGALEMHVQPVWLWGAEEWEREWGRERGRMDVWDGGRD